jgi:type II secretion system protein J
MNKSCKLHQERAASPGHPGHATAAPAGSGQAFTLLEVLLAVAIFSVVLIAIHFVFYSAIRLRNVTTEAIESKLPLQQTMAIIKRDLSNIVLPGGTLSGELQTTATSGALSGRNTSLTDMSSVPGQSSPAFHTACGVLNDLAPWSELTRVQYFLADPTNNTTGKDLFRSVTRNLLPTLADEPEVQFLMSGIESVYFYFFDGTQWRDYWDSASETAKLPQAIKIELLPAFEEARQVRREPLTLVVPLMVQASTNETAQAEGGVL